MATYTAQSVRTYDVPGNFPLTSASDGSFTVDDGDAAMDDFTLDEAVSVGADTLFYAGTINVLINFNAVVVPVFVDDVSDPTTLTVFSPATTATTNFPALVALGNVTTASFTPCFLSGTNIATPEGPRLVETLKPGDLILTADKATTQVRWVGRKTLARAFTPQTHRPVRIQAGALGAGLPVADLTVTPDHAMLLDGILVEARALNGLPGITAATNLPDQFTVYHIETEGHATLVAEGAPAESFVDYAGRRQFDNYPEYLALCGEDDDTAEQPLPRITQAAQLPKHLLHKLCADRVA